MGSSLPPGRPWRNWAGNQSCQPRHLAAPQSEDETVALVRAAVATGLNVRVAGAGHSFTPIVATDGLLLDLSALSGVHVVDATSRRVTVGAGTTVAALGAPLWEHGLALANQGDIDTQQLGGAIATATHGSGIDLATFSGAVRGLRMVTAAGLVLDVDDERPDLLRAARCAIGTLGVVMRVELEVAHAYRLRERIEHRPFADVLDRWDALVDAHRHFSFFWLPSERSAALYGLDAGPGAQADTCYVKVYDEAAPDEPDSAATGRRVDRSHRIYPGEFEPTFHELEYFVPYERGREAVVAMRELMLHWLPDSVFPMEVRTTGPDDAFLSPADGQRTTVISVSGVAGSDYWPYLRAVDALLGELGARVHWGKLHLLTREQLDRRYPGAASFRRQRAELDPAGTFLTPELAELLG